MVVICICNALTIYLIHCSLWDANEARRVRKFADHTEIVNHCAVAMNNPFLFASCSDDCSIILYDIRTKGIVSTFVCEYPILSVALSGDGEDVIGGGVEGMIKIWDTQKMGLEERLSLPAHDDIITGLSYHAPTSRLLSNGMDNALRVWDVGAFAENDERRLIQELGGHQVLSFIIFSLSFFLSIC